MLTVLSLLAGLAWGLGAAWLNSHITAYFAAKGGSASALTLAHMPVDIIALGAIVLVRNILPLRFDFCLVAAAAALGMGTVFFACRLADPVNKK